jgi:hypothetical protein
MSDSSSLPSGIKQFLTEEQVEIERQRRQADWERVRSAQDPLGRNITSLDGSHRHYIDLNYSDAPPEVFDNRSLYEKLKVQHDAKKKDFEDTWAASE